MSEKDEMTIDESLEIKYYQPVACETQKRRYPSYNIFDTLRKEEDKASVTLSFEPTKPVR